MAGVGGSRRPPRRTAPTHRPSAHAPFDPATPPPPKPSPAPPHLPRRPAVHVQGVQGLAGPAVRGHDQAAVGRAEQAALHVLQPPRRVAAVVGGGPGAIQQAVSTIPGVALLPVTERKVAVIAAAAVGGGASPSPWRPLLQCHPAQQIGRGLMLVHPLLLLWEWGAGGVGGPR